MTLKGVTGDSTDLTTSYGYDFAGYLTKVTKPLKNGIALARDNAERVVGTIRTDGNGLQHEQLTTQYDGMDHRLSESAQGCSTPSATCAAWSTTQSEQYAYLYTGDLETIMEPTPSGATKKLWYDNQGHVSTFEDENHPGLLGPTISDYGYQHDLAGRMIAAYRYTPAKLLQTSYTYDLDDNVTSVADPNGNVTTYQYDDFGRLQKEVSPVQGTTTYSSDPAGNLTSSTDANGVITTRSYDVLDRELAERNTNGSTNETTSWSYDDATAGHFGIGRLASHTDASGATAYTYDRHGYVAVENHTISGKAFTQSYTYDANANRKTITYPDGYIVGTGYDFADRPYSSQHQLTLSGAQLQSLGRSGLRAPLTNPTAEPVIKSASSFNLSKMVQTPLSSVPIARIAPRRMVGALNSRGVLRPSVLAAPALRTLVRPQAIRRRLAVANTVSADIFVSATTYEPFGPMNAMAFGNGTQQSITYDQRYLPTDNQLVSPGNAVLADHGYTEDAVGNITALNDNLDAGYNRSFAYDDLNRLTTANSRSKLWGTAPDNGYTHDDMGNVKTLQLGATRTDAFTYKAGSAGSSGLPQLASVLENGTNRTVSYDAAGNETADGKGTSAYTLRELLASDSQSIGSYAHDAFRKRVSTTLKSGPVRDSFFDSDQHLLAETAQFTTGTPTIADKYVWFGDRPVAQVDSTGTHWTYADHLGTPLQQTGLTAATTWQAEHEPYGAVYALRSGDVHQPLRLPGQVAEQFDAGANGLTERSYNNARCYHPNWGRYTQADPIGLYGGNNTYRYAGDNPTDAVDPSGLCLIQVRYHEIEDFGGIFNFASHGFLTVSEMMASARRVYFTTRNLVATCFSEPVSLPGAVIGIAARAFRLDYEAPTIERFRNTKHRTPSSTTINRARAIAILSSKR